MTVQAWMGHASIATTNLYLHHLGTTADRAGLDRLNRRGHTGGHGAWLSPNDILQIRERFSVSHLVRACYWMVELRGLEPLTFSLRTRRATSCAIAPRIGVADQHRDFTTVTRRRPGAIRRQRRQEVSQMASPARPR